MTKIEEKYGRYRLGTASSLNDVANLVILFFYCEDEPTFVEYATNQWRIILPSGKDSDCIAVKVGKRFYFLSAPHLNIMEGGDG